VMFIMLVMFFATNVFAAGTCTIVESTSSQSLYNILTFNCTGDSATGAFPSTTTSVGNSAFIYGTALCGMETNPGATKPTDEYDIVINNAGGRDILGGQGTNRDETNTEYVVPKMDTITGQVGCTPVDTALTLAITNNSVKSAIVSVKLYFLKKGRY